MVYGDDSYHSMQATPKQKPGQFFESRWMVSRGARNLILTRARGLNLREHAP